MSTFRRPLQAPAIVRRPNAAAPATGPENLFARWGSITRAVIDASSGGSPNPPPVSLEKSSLGCFVALAHEANSLVKIGKLV